MKSKKKEQRSLKKAEEFAEQQGASGIFRVRGSFGIFDMIIFFRTHIKAVQIKSGGQYVSAIEREQMELFSCPRNVSKEIWRFPDRKPVRVEVL